MVPGQRSKKYCPLFMSRSRKKTPILPIACVSRGGVKRWKKMYNRTMRRCKDEEHPRKDEYADEWLGPCDGKKYYKNPDPKWMRK